MGAANVAGDFEGFFLAFFSDVDGVGLFHSPQKNKRWYDVYAVGPKSKIPLSVG